MSGTRKAHVIAATCFFVLGVLSVLGVVCFRGKARPELDNAPTRSKKSCIFGDHAEKREAAETVPAQKGQGPHEEFAARKDAGKTEPTRRRETGASEKRTEKRESAKVCVQFKDHDGKIFMRREYCRSSTVFRVSEYLRMAIKKYPGSMLGQDTVCDVPRVVLSCDPEMFEAVRRLLDAPVEGIFDTEDILDVLCLSDFLVLDNETKKAALYRNLAKVTSKDIEGSMEEIERNRDMPCVKAYMLQLLRECSSLDVYFEDGRATLCSPAVDKRPSGSTDKVGVVSEMVVLKGAMEAIAQQDAFFLFRLFRKLIKLLTFTQQDNYRLLRRIVCAMDVKELDVSKCDLNTDAMKWIGRMTSITRLDMRECKGLTGGFSYLEGLGTLTELDVSYNTLNEDDMRAVGKMTKLAWLNVSGCKKPLGSFVHLQDLVNLTELDALLNNLNEDDMQAIGRMTKLTWLSMGGCKKPSGSFVHLQGLGNLTELDVSYNTLNEDDMRAVGKMTKLKWLSIGGCMVRPGSLAYLQDLVNLTELDISVSMLRTSDMQVIGKIISLTRLDVSKCEVRSGTFVHLQGLPNLLELDVSLNTLNDDDMQAIGKMPMLRKLILRGCEIPSGSLEHLRGLCNLAVLVGPSDEMQWPSLSPADAQQHLAVTPAGSKGFGSEGESASCSAEQPAAFSALLPTPLPRSRAWSAREELLMSPSGAKTAQQ